MARAILLLGLVATAAIAQDRPIDPTQTKALENALRGFKFEKAKQVNNPATAATGSEHSCAVPLLQAPVKTDVDKGMAHRVTGAADLRIVLPPPMPACESNNSAAAKPAPDAH